MTKEKKVKELRLNPSLLEYRADEQDNSKMIVEGYPVVFDKEAFIGEEDWGWYETIDRHAFDGADMSDVCLRYNHDEFMFICARTRNKSLELRIDEKGLWMHAELVETSTNKDIYEMVRSGLLTEGSFAFTVLDDDQHLENGHVHRTIKKIGKLFDVSICPNGAYGDLTEIYARSRDLVETGHDHSEEEKLAEVIRLRNANKIKLARRETK